MTNPFDAPYPKSSCLVLLLIAACSASDPVDIPRGLAPGTKLADGASPPPEMGGADTGGSIGTGDPPSPTAVELPPGVIIEEDDTEVTLDKPTGAGAGDNEPAPFGCGDGELTEDEACDDGNVASGDGCASNCRSLEPGFSCAVQGKTCLPIARCSDGVVAPSEQCDDGNPNDEDGCSARCRIEVGKKCEGAPSICTDALCGDGIPEGAEACDDGNTVPFDGCSADCSKEPNCAGTSCTSECGDGMAIDEECDDANRIDGDGCSAACTVEHGFSCEQISKCEQIGGVCALRIPVIYRDFSELHPDFGSLQCNDLAQGAVAHELGATGKPVFGDAPSAQGACLSTDAQFGEWYTDTELSETLVGQLVLFDNDAGGYVNRYGANGERFVAVDPASEKRGGADLAECEETCVSHARNGEKPMFDEPLRCTDVCRPLEQERSELVSGELSQLQGDLNRASDAVPRDEARLAEIEAAIATIEAQVDSATQALTLCAADCDVQLAERVAVCAETCKPCGDDSQRWCIGGTTTSFDGNPLFFPVDAITGETANSEPALIAEQYGYSSWPWERDVFPAATDHNFFFTSEVKHWFRYAADTQATLEFLGDDDVWVFINRRLAVDLGGVHSPASGSVTIDASTATVRTVVTDGLQDGVSTASDASAAEFGLEEGSVYEISVFHAERQLNGSSFKLTLAGFEAERSDCQATCGDGILSFGEECDDRANDGGHGECAAGCVLGPFCGDGVVQSEFGETCDDGATGGTRCRGCRVLTPPRVR